MCNLLLSSAICFGFRSFLAATKQRYATVDVSDETSHALLGTFKVAVCNFNLRACIDRHQFCIDGAVFFGIVLSPVTVFGQETVQNLPMETILLMAVIGQQGMSTGPGLWKY